MPNSVSVVITCHNLADYIGLAIESVLAQDYLGFVEVLVIDDCSTDESNVVIGSYKNIRCVRSDRNLGVLLATVLGLESTTGDLVFFLDGDDIWEPTKLSTIVERFESDPSLGFVTHDLSYIDGTGHLLGRISRSGMVMNDISSSCESTIIRDGILLHSDYVWLGSAYSVQRKLANLNEFCVFAKALPDPFNTYQDWPLGFWVACQPGVRCGYVSQKLLRYRLHGANHSGDATSEKKAVRNFGRSRNTMQAIDEIAKRFVADTHVKEVTRQKLCFYSYLHALYLGFRWRATKEFVANMPYITSTATLFWKESVRFAGVQILGVKHFIRLTRTLK